MASPTAAAPPSLSELWAERSMSLTSDTPECNICNWYYDDEDEDLVPRNLDCGHSFCSSESV